MGECNEEVRLMISLKGKFASLSEDYATGNLNITFSVEQKDLLKESYPNLQKLGLLDIKISKHREKRSLDANAYFHLLNSKLADKLEISKPRCKNILIGRYGQPFIAGDVEAIIKTNIDTSSMLEYENVHCMPCGRKVENGVEVYYYRMMRGSSTYNTAEMSILISGTVSECKEMGIDTMTPEEEARILALWKNKEQ